MNVITRRIALMMALPSMPIGCSQPPDGDLRRQITILQAQLAEAHAVTADCRRKARASVDVPDMVGSGPGISLDDLNESENIQGNTDNSSSSLGF